MSPRIVNTARSKESILPLLLIGEQASFSMGILRKQIKIINVSIKTLDILYEEKCFLIRKSFA